MVNPNIFVGVMHLFLYESALGKKEIYYLYPTFGNKGKNLVYLFVPSHLEGTTQLRIVIKSLQNLVSNVLTANINYISTQS